MMFSATVVVCVVRLRHPTAWIQTAKWLTALIETKCSGEQPQCKECRELDLSCVYELSRKDRLHESVYRRHQILPPILILEQDNRTETFSHITSSRCQPSYERRRQKEDSRCS